MKIQLSKRSLVLALAMGLLLTTLPAMAQTPPRVSPMSTVEQTVGLAEISVTYSRPSVKERKIWGELVPMGEVWRTGANEATTITLSEDAKVNGQALAAGTYGLFTIPGKDKWTVIFNKDAEQWGSMGYKDSEDVLRVEVEPQAAPHRETFSITFPQASIDEAVAHLHWEKVAVEFTIAFDTQALAATKARAFVANAGPQDGRAIWNWANYCLQNDIITDEAEQWAGTMAGQAPSYWTMALHARLQAKNGKTQEAMSTAKKALELAKADTSGNRGLTTDSGRLADELKSWMGGS